MTSILPEVAAIENRIQSFFQNMCVGPLFRQCNLNKEKGVSLETLYQFLVALVFTGRNLYRLHDSNSLPAGIAKDTVYRLLNSTAVNWRRFLHLLSTQVIVQRLLPLTDEKTTKVLIADDTLYKRDRSKHVELLARIHDHNTKRYHRGFRMLTLGWSDGNSFVPLSVSVLSSPKETNRLVPMRNDLDKRSNGYKRRRESMRNTTDILIDMVSLAISAGAKARHLLVDSWFAFPATLRRLKFLGMDTVCMLKDTGTIHYEMQGWSYTLKELYQSVRKRCGRAKVLAEVEVTIGEDEKGVPVAAKIVFVRGRSTKNWLALLSTDTTLSAEEIITLYRRRWDIEVFFKIAKSFLQLAKEFQSRSFDAVVAQATLVCCRYIMLELSRREQNDPRTLGSLFYAVSDEMQQIGFTEALALLLKLLEEALSQFVGLCKEQVQKFIQCFIESLPSLYKDKMLLLTQNGQINLSKSVG